MPSSVLDVGTGFGRWGVLCREFLDAWEGREARALWRVRIEGIEAFPSCLTPLHGYIYDRIHVGDAVDLLPTLGDYDVIYLGDVVEHQTKPRAWQLMDAAVNHARQAAIVTIPIGDNWPQEVGADGNWYHAHRSTWDLGDFDRYPGAVRQAFSDYHGRLYLVVELPGRARALRPTAALELPVPAPDPVLEQTSGCDGLLDRLDENLACRGLVDVEHVNQEVSGTLVFQLPVAAEIRRRLDRLEADGLPWAPSFAAMVDALFRHLVAREGMVLSQGRPLAPAADAVDVLERLAIVLANLADHSDGLSELTSVVRNLQAQLARPRSDTQERDLVSARSVADCSGRRH